MLVVGSGAMGQACIFHMLSTWPLEAMTICDRPEPTLCRAQDRAYATSHSVPVACVRLDAGNSDALETLCHNHDLIVSGLPWEAHRLLLEASFAAGKTVLSLARPDYCEVPALHERAKACGVMNVFGCGLEPGLTEVFGRYLAESLDEPHELHIRCGGIPKSPAPPFGYKVVFGGNEVPFDLRDSYVVEGGTLKKVARFSGIEPFHFPGVGELEAWNDGLLPWFRNSPAVGAVHTLTQKTLRWPGYASRVLMLAELGLMSREPIDVDGQRVVPKRLLDAVLLPKMRYTEEDRDLVLLQVTAKGLRQGRPLTLTLRLCDTHDDATGLTAMARTTGFTCAIFARLVAEQKLFTAGVLSCEKVLSGVHVERLIAGLRAAGITIALEAKRVGAKAASAMYPSV